MRSSRALLITAALTATGCGTVAQTSSVLPTDETVPSASVPSTPTLLTDTSTTSAPIGDQAGPAAAVKSCNFDVPLVSSLPFEEGEGNLGLLPSLSSSPFVDVVAVQEFVPSARPTSTVGPIAMSSSGTAIAATIDHKGPDSVLISNDRGGTWENVGTFADVGSIALDPSGQTIAIADQGVLWLSTAGKKIAISEPPVKQPLAEDLLFLSSDKLLVVIDELVDDSLSDVATLANLWSYSISSSTWSRVTSFQTQGEPWYAVRTPILDLDANEILFLVLTNEPSGQGLWLWSANVELDGSLGEPVKLRKVADSDSALVAATNPSKLLWASMDVSGTWHLVTEDFGVYRDLGCARVASLPINNGDPDLN